MLAAGGFQDPEAEIVDQPGLLGERDELLRRHQPPFRVMPAHQRLDADHLAGAQVDLRLIDQGELPLVDRAPELGLEHDALERGAVHLGVDQLPAIAAVGLRPVKRHVRRLQQLVGAAAVVGKQG